MIRTQGLRIAFIHPDLGLGGAERLIVDAATELVKHGVTESSDQTPTYIDLIVTTLHAGHTVHIYTAYYDPNRCFEETKGSGGFKVTVAGGWFPRHVFGRMVALCAYVRCILAALYVVWISWTQRSTTIKAGPWLQPCYDVVISDQVSASKPSSHVRRPLHVS